MYKRIRPAKAVAGRNERASVGRVDRRAARSGGILGRRPGLVGILRGFGVRAPANPRPLRYPEGRRFTAALDPRTSPGWRAPGQDRASWHSGSSTDWPTSTPLCSSTNLRPALWHRPTSPVQHQDVKLPATDEGLARAPASIVDHRVRVCAPVHRNRGPHAHQARDTNSRSPLCGASRKTLPNRWSGSCSRCQTRRRNATRRDRRHRIRHEFDDAAATGIADAVALSDYLARRVGDVHGPILRDRRGWSWRLTIRRVVMPSSASAATTGVVLRTVRRIVCTKA